MKNSWLSVGIGIALCAVASGVSTVQAFVTSNHPLSAINVLQPNVARAALPTNAAALTAPKQRQGEIAIKLREDSETHAALKQLRPGTKQAASVGSAAFQQLLRKHRATGIETAFRTTKVRNAKAKPKAAGRSRQPPDRTDLFRWYRVRLPEDADISKVAADFNNNPDVEFAEPNFERRLHDNIPYPISGIPDQTTDPNYDDQWHHTAVLTPPAWDHLRLNGVHPGGSHDVIVAVLDTGVDHTHPELAGNIWTNSREIPNNGIDDDANGFVDDIHGCSVVSDSRSHSGDSSDYHGHGTHVAGIVAAQGYNHLGGVGVAFNVQIMAVRVAHYSGILTAIDIAEGVLYAVDHGAEVLNMSFGGYQRSQIEEDALAVALSQALLVAAAGNDGLNGFEFPAFPAALPFVHGVMASTPTGRRAWFSNYGYDVAAPGVSIFSTLPGDTYAPWSGTSMAAPIVSGVAALLRSYYWQRDIYSSRYLMGAVWAASTPIINAYSAVTVLPQPGVSVLQTWLFDSPSIDPVNDGDGGIDSGETIHLALEVINRAGYATNVTATLRARAPSAVQDDPYVTILTTNVAFGDIGPWNTSDNGFIYDTNGVITGVTYPVIFRVDPNAPNEHRIQFELTITFGDAWNPNGGTVTRVSRFSYIVQRGKNLPSVISTNMTLTADQYWIVGGPVLVEPGVTLAIEPGTQVQWGAISSDPYNPGPQSGYMIVRGALSAHGTATNPISLFPSYLVSGQTTRITVDSGGWADLSYVRVRNPQVTDLRAVDHCSFEWDAYSSTVTAWRISKSLFGKFRGGGTIAAGSGIHTCLFDAGWIVPSAPVLENCTFLQDNENNRPLGFSLPVGYPDDMSRLWLWWGDTNYFHSPLTTNGETFVTLWIPSKGGCDCLDRTYAWRLAQTIATHFGGQIAPIRNQQEWDMIQAWLPTEPRLGNVTSYLIAMLNTDRPYEFTWLDGSPVTYSAWKPGQPAMAFLLDERETKVATRNSWDQFDWGWVNDAWRQAWEAEAYLLRLPGSWTLEQLRAPMRDGSMVEYVRSNYWSALRFNAFLNKYWDPDITKWMRFYASGPRGYYSDMRETYWGTDSTTLINHAIIDYFDNFNTPKVEYGTPPAHGFPTTYPFVEEILINGIAADTVPILEGGRTSFTVRFNRDMNTNVEPFVSFGPAPPHTDFRVYPRDDNFQVLSNGWIDARTWRGDVWITPVTGNGYHGIRVSGAQAVDDPWLVTGYDVARFRFRVQTTGVASMSLQANGGEGFIDLTWQQNDYDLVAGYNVYRSDAIDGTYVRLNSTLIPVGQEQYRDTNVAPAVQMFYRFTVVTTDFIESEPSVPAGAAAFDTIPPTISHVPLTAAPPGQSLRISALCSDNVAVTSVSLRYRLIGATTYASASMLNTASNNWSATLPGSSVQPPGLEYYIVVSDGLSDAFSGTPAAPHTTVVSDAPSVTSVSPSQGSAAGGDSVTVSGTQFQPGASVLFGGALANNIVIISANQISCTTPPHFPASVEVKVVNTNGTFASKLNGFLYTSSNAVVSLPNVTGDYGTVADVLVSASDLVGLRGADLTVLFDSTVLSPASVSVAAMTAGWAVTANTSVPGRVVISMASATAVSGSGPIVRLGFNVLAPPPANSFLRLTNVVLNDGSLPTVLQNGSFTVNGFWSVRGTVRHSSGQTIGDASLAIVGVGSQQTTSSADGTFVFTNLPTGSYVLSPSKLNGTNGITAYDASLVLQAAVGLLALTPEQVLAADVNRNSIVNALDAAYILEYAVGLLGVPFPNAGKVWDFVPAFRSYATLSSDLVGQDFNGVLIGDVSGNWMAGTPDRHETKSGVEGSSSPVIALDSQKVRVTQQVHRVLFNCATAAVYSLELALQYPATGTVVAVESGPAANGFAFVANTNQSGVVRVAMAGAQPLAATGEIARLVFDARSVLPSVRTAAINEGDTPVRIDSAADDFDADGDGLIDIDERSFGTDPAAADSDGDGLKDGAEILAGTSPLNAASVLRILRVVQTGPAEITVTWTGVPGRRYQLEAAPSLGGAWTLRPTVYTATEGEVSTPVPVTNGFGVYRVRLAD